MKFGYFNCLFVVFFLVFFLWLFYLCCNDYFIRNTIDNLIVEINELIPVVINFEYCVKIHTRIHTISKQR